MKTEEVEGRTMTLSVIAMRKGCPGSGELRKRGLLGPRTAQSSPKEWYER